MPEYVLNQSSQKLTKVFTLGGATESAAIKFDLSAMPTIDGKAITRFSVEKMKWACTAGMGVKVIFDRTVVQEVAILASAGRRKQEDGAVKDKGTGGTGDIVFTTVGGGAGQSYWCEIEVGLHTD
jgi:hypothetical protein